MANPAAAKELERLGYAIPAIMIDGGVVIGFNPKCLGRLLGL